MTSYTATDVSDSPSFAMAIEGRVLAVGDLLEWRMDAWLAENRDDPKPHAQPIAIEARRDGLGEWTDTAAQGKHPVSGAELVPGTVEHEHVLSLVLDSFPKLPREPVGQGDELLYGGQEEELEREYAEQLGGDAWVDLSWPVIGETTEAGRRGIVTKITGSITARANGARGTIYLSGYAVYDVETGLIAKSVMTTTMPWAGSGSMEWTIITTVRETRFH
jgi:hypothetical protein